MADSTAVVVCASGFSASPADFSAWYDISLSLAAATATPFDSYPHFLLRQSFGGPPLKLVRPGEACPSTHQGVVMMKYSDYSEISGGFTGFNLEDVALILPSVALVWAVAWLFKRLLAVLRNQL